MSNPFRRKINAEPQSSIPTNLAGTGASQPLSINTGTKAEKHVRIASPPDTAISPASYPSSPEFVRLTPSPQQTIVPYTVNASLQTPKGDSFGAADSSANDDDDDDEDNDEQEVVSEALENTRLNIASTRVPTTEAPNRPEDAVQNTLSKFASRPRDGKGPTISSVAEAPKQDSKRQTMDVDAFTRLLLTGGGGSTQGTPGPSPAANSGPPNAFSESSSTADSASISRQSIFEPMPPIAADSPRTSHELDEAESAATRRSVGSSEAKKPPPAPAPRHGKRIKQTQSAPAEPIRQIPHTPTVMSTSPEPRSPKSDLNKPLPPPPASISDSSRRSSTTSIAGTDPTMQIKRPPTPPLSRRRSQGPTKPPLSRSSPSLQSLTAIAQSPSSSTLSTQATKAPPPPPIRRISQRISETTSSSSLRSTSEETAPVDLSKPIMPQLSRTTSAATRASIMSSENAPPLPPPRRRQRGSSSASQRPSIAVTSSSTVAGSGRNSIEGQKPDLEAMRKTSEGESRDILKDLASLQAEVDALRRQGLRE